MSTNPAALDPDSVQSLRHIALLAEIPKTTLNEIEAMARWHRIPANEIVIDRDDTSTDIFFICRGRVSIIDELLSPDSSRFCCAAPTSPWRCCASSPCWSG